MSEPNIPQQLEFRLKIQSVLWLDPERIEEDPVWLLVAEKYDLTVGEGRRQALVEYISRYLQRERLLADMPSTNGPATPASIEIEFI